MDRREFLTATAALTATTALGSTASLAARPYKNGINGITLSVIGFGGIVVCGLSQEEASRRVAEAHDRGVNYFDCAPSYFDGEAEIKLGEALRPYRHKIFLAEKTTRRDAQGARKELERTLQRFHTDHVDLYQFHPVGSITDVARILHPEARRRRSLPPGKRARSGPRILCPSHARGSPPDGCARPGQSFFPVNANAWENGVRPADSGQSEIEGPGADGAEDTCVGPVACWYGLDWWACS